MAPIEPVRRIADAARLELDSELVNGFAFECRPDCGLCCYAGPAVDRTEEQGLLALDANAPFVTGGSGGRYIAQRPGGACPFLLAHRCEVHARRPSPCRIYPLTIAVGIRIQASVVLSCPGLKLDSLGSRTARTDPPRGLDAELREARRRCEGPRVREQQQRATLDRGRIRRFLLRRDRWRDEEEVRAEVARALPLPTDSDLPGETVPELEQGIDFLPLHFDGGEAPVAMASHPGGHQFVRVEPDGSISQWLGVVPTPTRVPGMDLEARSALLGYLRYWLERDSLFDALLPRLVEPGETLTVEEAVREELRWIGATVISRAGMRARVEGREANLLGLQDLEGGIRSTDGDLLDRPGYGARF